MSMEYIRNYYKVPAKRGGKIIFDYPDPRIGVITSAQGHYIRVRFPEHKHSLILHPTWKVEYLN